MINGMAVVIASAEVDITTAEQLRMTLLEAGSLGRATVVVDMTRTQFCDSAGLSVLVRAHRRALAEGRELRLVLPAEGPVVRVLTVTGLDRLIPSFGSLGQALALTPGRGAAADPLPRRHPSPASIGGSSSHPVGWR